MGMAKLSASDRLSLICFFAGAALACLAWAFPNMTRLITIPAAMLFFCLAIRFAWPEIKIACQWLVRPFTKHLFGPVTFEWNRNLLRSMGVNGHVLIRGFEIKGRNHQKEPVFPKAVYIRSDLTGAVVKLGFATSNDVRSGAIPASQACIPSESDFRLIGDVKVSNPQMPWGISLEEFQSDYGEFSFFFEFADRPPFAKKFTRKEINSSILAVSNPLRSPQKRVRPRAPNSSEDEMS